MSTQPNYHLSDFSRIHFIGIGGIGISALANFCVAEGKQVSGTNDCESPVTLDGLRAKGVEISLDTSVLPPADLYVFSEAWRTFNPALLEQAFTSGVPTINYFDALGLLANDYYLVAVSGTHGKTTTTAMLIDILESAGFDPSAVVGSLRTKSQTNYRVGKSKYFIAEACEYRRDFMSLKPDILIITNIEHEHVDYYKDLKAVQAAFRELAEKVPEEGFIVANLDEASVKEVLTDNIKATVVDYTQSLNILRKLKVPGLHNQLNAAAAKAAAALVGVPEAACETALTNFSGTWRRFEYKGEVNGAKVYDDYGHHPTEIKVTVAGARQLYPKARLKLVFQPHTYSRTQGLFKDFVSTLILADEVHLLPIYAAREEKEGSISSEQLAKAIAATGHAAQVWPDFASVIAALKAEAKSGEVILVMGAGNVTDVATELTA